MTALLIHAVHTPLASDGRKRLWRHPETKEKASQIGENALVKGEPFKKQRFLQKSVDRFYSLCYIITCSEPNGTVKTKRHGGIAQLGEQVTSKATRNRNAASKS